MSWQSGPGRVENGIGEATPVGLTMVSAKRLRRVEEGVGEEDQRPSTGASVGRLRGVWTKRLRWGV